MRSAAIALAVVAALFGCDATEYQGRPLSSWLSELDDEHDYKRRNALLAVTGIAREGKPKPRAFIDALPKVAALLDDPNPGVQEYARDALVAVDGPARDLLFRAMDRPKANLRFHGAVGVLALERENESAMRVLLQTLTMHGAPELAAEAQAALVALGAPAVEPLIDALDERDRTTQLLAVQTLGKMEGAARDAVPTLHAIARTDLDEELRVAALFAIARIASPEQGIAIFEELRRSAPERVASQAAVMLRRFENREAPTVQQAADAAAAATREARED